MSAELRRVQMESNRNIDGVTKRYVATLEQRGAERSVSSSVTTMVYMVTTTSSGYRGPSYARGAQSFKTS